jgi:hypothetical protein
MNSWSTTWRRESTSQRPRWVAGTGVPIELGMPFAVTVDLQTLTDHTVSLRERDSMKQVRLSKENIPLLLMKIICKKITWEQIMQNYPVVHPVVQVEDGEGGAPTEAFGETTPTTVIETIEDDFDDPPGLARDQTRLDRS